MQKTTLNKPNEKSAEVVKVNAMLEEESKQFTAKKKFGGPPKPMTSRIYLMGMAMNALLSRSTGMVRRDDVKREAEEWADFMLED